MELPTLVQKIEADVTAYIRGMERATDVLRGLEGANTQLLPSIQNINNLITSASDAYQQHKAVLQGVTQETKNYIKAVDEGIRKLEASEKAMRKIASLRGQTPSEKMIEGMSLSSTGKKSGYLDFASFERGATPAELKALQSIMKVDPEKLIQGRIDAARERGATPAELKALQSIMKVDPLAAQMGTGTVPDSMIARLSQWTKSQVDPEKLIQGNIDAMRERAATAKELAEINKQIAATLDPLAGKMGTGTVPDSMTARLSEWSNQQKKQEEIAKAAMQFERGATPAELRAIQSIMKVDPLAARMGTGYVPDSMTARLSQWYKDQKDLEEKSKLPGRIDAAKERAATAKEMRDIENLFKERNDAIEKSYKKYQDQRNRIREALIGKSSFDKLKNEIFNPDKGGLAGYVTGKVVDAGSIALISAMAAATTALGVASYAAYKGFSFLSNAIHDSVTEGMKMEKMQVTFGVLAGGMGKGKELFSEIQRFSTQSPFSVDQLSDSAQVLMGMGVSIDNLIPSLKRLGDVAGGDTDRLKRLALVAGEVRAEGKLTGLRIRQFASLGVGVEDFAKTAGVQGGAFRALLSAQMVPGSIVTDTINRLTDKGGRFFEMTKASLETVSGQWTRFDNTVKVSTSTFGEAFLSSSKLRDAIASIATYFESGIPNMRKWGLALGQAIAPFIADIPVAVKAFQDMVTGGGLGLLFPRSSMLDPFKQMEDSSKTMMERVIDLGTIMAKVLANITSGIMNAISMIPTLIADILDGLSLFMESLPGGFGGKRTTPAMSLSNEQYKKMTPSDMFFSNFTPQEAWELANGRGIVRPEVKGEGAAAKVQEAADAMRKKLTPGANMEMFLKDLEKMPNAIDALSGEMKLRFNQQKRMGAGEVSLGFSGAAGRIIDPQKMSPLAQKVIEDSYKELGVQTKQGFIAGGGGTVMEKFVNQMNANFEAYMGMDKPAFTRMQGRLSALQNVIPEKLGKPIENLGNIIGGPLGAALSGLGTVAGVGKIPPMGGLSKEAFERNQFNDYEKMRQSVTGGRSASDTLPRAMQFGSAEAMDTINKAQVDNRSIADEVISVLQAMLEQQQQQKEAQRETINAINNQARDLAEKAGIALLPQGI